MRVLAPSSMALAGVVALGLVLLASGPALATCPPFCGRSPSESSRPPMVRPPMVPRPPAAEALRRQQELRQTQQWAKNRFNKFKDSNGAFFRDRLAFFRDRFAFKDRFEFRDRFDFRNRLERAAKRREVIRRTFGEERRGDIEDSWRQTWGEARSKVSGESQEMVATRTRAGAAFSLGQYLFERGNFDGALPFFKEAREQYSKFVSQLGDQAPKVYGQLVGELDSLISDYNRVRQSKQSSALGKAASGFSSKADAMFTALEYGGGDTGASFRYLETARNADPNDPIVGEALNDMRAIFGTAQAEGSQGPSSDKSASVVQPGDVLTHTSIPSPSSLEAKQRQSRERAREIRAGIAKTFGPSPRATGVTSGEMLLSLPQYVSYGDMLWGFGSEAVKIWSVVSGFGAGAVAELRALYVGRQAAARGAPKLVARGAPKVIARGAPKLVTPKGYQRHDIYVTAKQFDARAPGRDLFQMNRKLLEKPGNYTVFNIKQANGTVTQFGYTAPPLP